MATAGTATAPSVFESPYTLTSNMEDHWRWPAVDATSTRLVGDPFAKVMHYHVWSEKCTLEEKRLDTDVGSANSDRT